ncbi:DUF3343 domain-containing protein [Fusobacterium sp.]|uniref:DUF3343 domain-containing protein n=1 Tax=Fusobacterium sp. TaxID=68766 RepID=UPI00396C3009
MIKNEQFLLLVSDSTHFIMKLEKELQISGICCRIIPLPGEISAGCGLSIKVDLAYEKQVDSILKDKNIHVEKFLVEKTGLKKKVHKL